MATLALASFRSCFFQVQPSETTSLYRLVKSLVHRSTLESKAAWKIAATQSHGQTADVIERINDCNFDKMLQAHGAQSGATVLEMTKARPF